MYTMLPLLTHVLYVRICLSSGSVKVILTCCDSAYPFTAVVPYPVVYMYIYLPCVAVMLDRWSNSLVTVYRHSRNSLATGINARYVLATLVVIHG